MKKIIDFMEENAVYKGVGLRIGKWRVAGHIL